MKHDGTWHERQWQRIETEFDEPACEVVRVMHHEMHLPLCHIAKTLGVCKETLIKWCEMWDLPTFKSGYHKLPSPGKVQRRAKELGYISVSQAIGSMRVEGLRWKDIQQLLSCSSSTVSHYLPIGAKGYYNLTEGGRQVKRRVRQRLNAEGKGGRMPKLDLVVPIS